MSQRLSSRALEIPAVTKLETPKETASPSSSPPPDSKDVLQGLALHPVIDLWPRLLQSDEYLVIFHKRPLGIRVRQDWEEKNAVVWKVQGDYAKKAGVERGSMIYTINGENVSGKSHAFILQTLQEAP